MNNIIKPSTILTDKVEFIELPKDSYQQDSDLLIYPSGKMFFFYLCFQVNWQQTLWSFTTPKTRRKDLRDLCKLNVKTVNLSKAFTLLLKLTTPKTIIVEESKLRRSKLELYAVSKVSGFVIHHLLSCVVSWTCPHLWPKVHMMAYDLGVLSEAWNILHFLLWRWWK